ncbi:MAG: AEC family transporter [Rhodospirillales bacterium]|nr:AEC family transporter [Rhodospirillales bacterium]
MSVFLALLLNIFPLYILIGIGYAAGRFFAIDRQTLANLALFVFVPVVAFGFVAKMEFQPAYILLPFLIFALQCLIGFSFLAIGKKAFGDNRANLLAITTATANSGYFGLPVVILLFNDVWVGVYSFMLVGMIFFEATILYYIAARGHFSVRDSLKRVAKFPVLYAVLLGLAVNALSIELPEIFDTYWTHFKGAYVVCGMMIIGVALSKAERLVFSARFMGLAFAAKFLLWPLIALGLITLDNSVTHLFAPEVHDLLFVLSVLPPAANVAAFAAQLNLQPEKAATTVLLGTLLGLFYIPLVLMLAGFTLPS